MVELLDVSVVCELHHRSIVRWYEAGVELCERGFLRIVEENHAFNYQLWLAEDRARREDRGYEFVYHAKREIDACNQQRNNRMEAMDAWLIETMQPPSVTHCAVHSETPGMMIDRLSILSLKTYHMGLQVDRQDVDQSHRALCQYKTELLEAQRKQLADCLHRLLSEVMERTRTFCVYGQFKMYNDKALNPQLYQASL